MNTVQNMYSAIVVRGRRNSPTYNEVKRDATAVADQETAAALLNVRI